MLEPVNTPLACYWNKTEVSGETGGMTFGRPNTSLDGLFFTLHSSLFTRPEVLVAPIP